MEPIFEYPILILERHLDTFGHVNNATYLELFEEARWDLITRNGFGLREVQSRKQGPVILKITIDFKKELKLRQMVVIKTQLQSYEKKVGILRQWMEVDGEDACSADFVFGLFDLKVRKLIEPTPEWWKAMGR